MSLSSDDPISPTEKNQEPRKSPQDSSSLSSKETEKKISSQEPHHETSHSFVSPMNTTNEEPLKSDYDSLWENLNYFESHNITGNLLNTSGTLARSLDLGSSQSYLDTNYITNSVSPMNTTNEEALKSRHGSSLENRNLLNPFGNMFGGSLDSVGSQMYLDSIQMMTNTGFVNSDQSQLDVEASSNSDGWYASMNSDVEALISRYESFWENPYYHESDNITMNTGNLLMNPSGGMFGGSQIDPDPVQKIHTSKDVNNNNDQSDLGVEGSIDSDGRSQMGVGMEQEMQASSEGYGTNPLRYQNNIPFGSIEATIDIVKRDKEEIFMIPTPSYANRAQWPIKKILTKSDVSMSGTLWLPNKKNFIEKYFQKRLPEADFRDLVGKSGIKVIVYDNDEHTTHHMYLRNYDKKYTLLGEWRKGFIEKRKLKEGQEIGLFFDSSDARLHFSVLNREIAKVPAKEKKQ